MKTYHTGFYQRRNTIVFQFKHSIDALSCELLEYLGERETTKSAALARFKGNKEKVLADLQARYPHRNIKNVIVEV